MRNTAPFVNTSMRADAQKNYDHLLTIARSVFAERGADASLRDVARRAGVGLGTLYRHFPTREALLEAMLRTGFEQLTSRATKLETSDPADEALVAWVGEVVSLAHIHSGVIASMVSAIEDPESALHASCLTMKAAGARLLARAQTKDLARKDVDGADLFALIGALAWLHDQPPFAPRMDHLFRLISGSLFDQTGKGSGSGLPSSPPVVDVGAQRRGRSE